MRNPPSTHQTSISFLKTASSTKKHLPTNQQKHAEVLRKKPGEKNEAPNHSLTLTTKGLGLETPTEAFKTNEIPQIAPNRSLPIPTVDG